VNPLASLPWWLLWVVLGVTFVVVHALAFQPRREAGGGRTLMRVVSSALLLVGLVVVDPAEPATVLLALAAAAGAGFLSGRAAPPRPTR
jgi:FtsH-binding integral membrane protein